MSILTMLFQLLQKIRGFGQTVQHCWCNTFLILALLILPLPSLLVPTPYTRGEGPAAISKTVAPMNLKFCRVLETSFNVFRNGKVLYIVFTWLHCNSSKERQFIGKIARFQPKIPIFKLLPNYSLKDNIMKRF